ncbi:MAG TPA: YihY/virulence factor BrkB family protein [Bryobacteraceae bacterium]|jgi:membrane protein
MPENAPFVLEAGGTEVATSAGGARRYRKPLACFGWVDIKFLLAETFNDWSRHKASRLGASLAFYTLLSLTPLLLIAVSVGALAFGEKTAEGHLLDEIRGLMGPQGAAGVQALLAGTRHTGHGILATAIGLLTLFFGASGVLIELRDALNTIWDVPPAQLPGLRSIIQMVKDRLFSFALVLAIGFLLLVSLVVNTAIAAAGAYFGSFLPAPEVVLHVANSLLSFVIITGLFAAIYKIMPDVRIEWRDVLLGAAVTSLLFTIGKFLIGLYLGKASFASTYGAAASVVILIVWVYYSGQVFFFGAEFTQIFASHYGSQPAGQKIQTAERSEPAGSNLVTPATRT